jgi:hypothetical protein
MVSDKLVNGCLYNIGGSGKCIRPERCVNLKDMDLETDYADGVKMKQ